MGDSGLHFLQFLSERRNETPCLVHSSEQYFGEGNVELSDLTKIGSIFNFATFHMKGNPTYIKDVLNRVQK